MSYVKSEFKWSKLYAKQNTQGAKKAKPCNQKQQLSDYIQF